MAGVSLYPYQMEAVRKMRNGCILCGGVGSGKSRTALGYYYLQQGGVLGPENYVRMQNPRDLYIITTARKRDTLEWEAELAPFGLSIKPEENPLRRPGGGGQLEQYSKIRSRHRRVFSF